MARPYDFYFLSMTDFEAVNILTSEVCNAKYEHRNAAKSTANMNIIIEKMPEHGMAAAQVTDYEVPGMDGALYHDRGALKTYKTSITINCNKSCTAADIYALFRGAGWLYDTETRRWRYVRFYDGASATRRRLGGRDYDSITIDMECDPYSYLQPIMTYGEEAAGFHLRDSRAVNDANISHLFQYNDQIAELPATGEVMRPLIVIENTAGTPMTNKLILRTVRTFTNPSGNSVETERDRWIIDLSDLQGNDGRAAGQLRVCIDCEAHELYTQRTEVVQTGTGTDVEIVWSNNVSLANTHCALTNAGGGSPWPELYPGDTLIIYPYNGTLGSRYDCTVFFRERRL